MPGNAKSSNSTAILIAFLLAGLIGMVVCGGIAGGIALTSGYLVLNKAQITANEQRALAHLHLFKASLQAFKLETSRFPSTEEGLPSLFERPTSLAAEERWSQTLSEPPGVDPWGNPYNYKLTPEEDVELWSSGMDGFSGTEDDLYLRP